MNYHLLPHNIIFGLIIIKPFTYQGNLLQGSVQLQNSYINIYCDLIASTGSL